MRKYHLLAFGGLASIVGITIFLIAGRHRTEPQMVDSPARLGSEPRQKQLTAESNDTQRRAPDDDVDRSAPDEATRAAPGTPTNAAELRALASWLRSLPRDELVQLTNSDFKFRDSKLIEMLQHLEGDWVIGELQDLAASETDSLVKATLMMGLFGGYLPSRHADPRMISALTALLPQLSMKEDDPYAVSATVIMAGASTCLVQKQPLAELVVPHLVHSDNEQLLLLGLDLVGQAGGADELLIDFVTAHPLREARIGALEGLRSATRRGRLTPEEITRIGKTALDAEPSQDNRILLMEMLGSVGGESGLATLEEVVASGKPGWTGPAATMLALKSEPKRALESLAAALRNPELSAEDRGALYRALGTVDSPESGQQLLDVAHDDALSETQRLQGLQGLWSRPADGELVRELSSIVESDAPAVLRAESLKMLAIDPSSAQALDVKNIATSDRDASVRREAVLLAALEGGADSGAWLEERLLSDRSPDVKAAALGAMVMQAHYTGNGDAVLDHLNRARRVTDDAQVQALIDQGEKLVREYDPRRIDLELREDAKFYDFVSKHTSGPAQRELQRQAVYLQRMVAALDSIAKH